MKMKEKNKVKQLPEIAAHLKKIRTEAGLSQSKLAKELDCTQQEIALIETGKRNLTIQTLVSISECLNHTVNITLEPRINKGKMKKD